MSCSSGTPSSWFREKGGRSPVSRILSSSTSSKMGDHFSHRRSGGPDKPGRRLIPGDSAGGQPFPCSVLHHAGFAVPPSLPSERWALTPPFHPYLCPRGSSAVCSLLHFPSGGIETSVPRFHGARCPAVSGLSSARFRKTHQRSPGERRRETSHPSGFSKLQYQPTRHPMKPTSTTNQTVMMTPTTIFTTREASVPTAEPTPELIAFRVSCFAKRASKP